jgi:class 3 adenylate cyclase
MTMHAYLPQDRLRALAHGETLPDRTTGATLFADISGFTPLTEALRETLGPRRGAEELTRHLDAVYTALIVQVERYGGSVISFAGDAITGWFDDARGSAAARATTCAFGLQQAMRAFTSIALSNGMTTALALKVAVASGPARRFVVGDPAIHYLDALAGATVARTSTAEHLAQRGDVLLDEATVTCVGSAISIREWRTDPDSPERFAVVEPGQAVAGQASENPNPRLPDPEVPIEQLRDWLHKAQVEREYSFLTEFRPCAVLFVRFVGIDYEADDAQAQLDGFIRQLQGITARYGGTVLQLTIGDKGSYIYINFGALGSHEDDTRRAVKTALEVRKKTDLHVQMGITQGVMRVGAYGGATRRTYGALGDEVNLAARLMTTAEVGEILLSGHVQKATANDVVFEPRSPLPMKGKAEPLPVFAVTGERQQRAVRLQEPTYALPMVGRVQELGSINDTLELALSAKGQVIGIVAEAGMGKSRLVAEVIRSAHKKGFVGYGGACQSDAVSTPYQAWKSIWQAFFDVDPTAPLRKQIRSLEGEIEDRVPERVEALPLLGILLNLDIPDNDFTKTLEPQYRQSVLRVLLEDCLRAAAKDEALLIVIEDLHWIDVLSHDLLEELARALSDSRVCFLLAYRPPQLARLEAPRIEAMSNFTRIELHELNAFEAESAIRAKLAQLYPLRGGALPIGLVDTLMARSQGNPFYLEELLNYVRDRGLDPEDLDKIELPDSLYTLILSRIDALAESEKSTLRVASIVGRLFRADWLRGYYPELGELPKVRHDLEQLAAMDITPLDSPEPELAYLFKHIVTHEVTYESLPFATRAHLHEQLAMYLEGINAPVDAIAHHYDLSNNAAKQREYWLKAGDAAYDAFANEAALEYYRRLSPALMSPQEQADLNLKRAGAYYALGKLTDAHDQLKFVFDGLGQPLPTTSWRLGGALLKEIARQIWHRLRFARQPVMIDDQSGAPPLNDTTLKLTRAYLLLALVDAQSDKADLLDVYSTLRGLNLSEAMRRRSHELAQSYANVGFMCGFLSHSLARAYFQRAQAILTESDNLPMLGEVLLAANLYALGVGDWQTGERNVAKVLEVCERLGDRKNWFLNLSLLGYMAGFQGQFARSLKLFTDSYQEALATNHLQHQAMALAGQAWLLFKTGETDRVITLAESTLPMFAQSTGLRIPEAVTYGMLASIYVRQGRFNQARQAATTANALLANVPLPVYTHGVTYGHLAEVYLALWEQDQNTTISEFKALAQQACRSLHKLMRLYPAGQPSTWRWQGLYDWLDAKPGRARRAWQKSLAAAQKLAMPYDEALAYYEIGRHATADEQTSHLARANEIFGQLGITGFGVQSSHIEE